MTFTNDQYIYLSLEIMNYPVSKLTGTSIMTCRPWIHRYVLFQILVTELSGSNRDAARSMSIEQQADKLEELRQLRELWREQQAARPEDQIDLLQVRV